MSVRRANGHPQYLDRPIHGVMPRFPCKMDAADFAVQRVPSDKAGRVVDAGNDGASVLPDGPVSKIFRPAYNFLNMRVHRFCNLFVVRRPDYRIHGQSPIRNQQLGYSLVNKCHSPEWGKGGAT